jgi:Zn-dependent M28 family amino/carboxypeptidase
MRYLLAILLLAPALYAAEEQSSIAPPLQPQPAARSIRRALETIDPEHLLADIKTLASDDFQGRAPASPGEEKTVTWLTEQFRQMGLQPGNPDGSWFQTVPMVAITAQEPVIRFEAKDQQFAPAFPADCVIWSKHQVPEVEVNNSEVFFAGYGVVAPEYGWDDFNNTDVRGKTILVLVNDPQVPDERDPQKLDLSKFKGRAMTYYGRWTYKYEIGALKGAAAVIIVHETDLAGYPWSVVVDSNSRENFDLQSADKNLGRAAIEGWITQQQASKLLAAAGFDYQALKKRALSKDFAPMPLGITATFSLKNKMRSVDSKNVVARIEGSNRKLKDENVIYTAHWDHLGRDPRLLPGDPVYHGALDNASGVAGLLELARAYRALSSRPKRSILFLSVTAEEKGLLGSRYYSQHPLYPLTNTLADLNMDVLNPWGRTRDIEIIGLGNSTLEDLLARAALAQGRSTVGESKPERGFFYRSDHFEFAKRGVPCLYFKAGTNYVDKPSEYGTEKMEEYVRQSYHKPSDTVRADWDLSGAVEDLRLLFQVGWEVAEGRQRPTWKPSSEFETESVKRLFHE